MATCFRYQPRSKYQQVNSYSTYKSHNNYIQLPDLCSTSKLSILTLCKNRGHHVRDSSHTRSVITKWAWLMNFNNNNDRQNEASTKVAYSMSETAWIANALADCFCNEMIRTSQRHFTNSTTGGAWKNVWNSEKLNSNGGQMQCQYANPSSRFCIVSTFHIYVYAKTCPNVVNSGSHCCIVM